MSDFNSREKQFKERIEELEDKLQNLQQQQENIVGKNISLHDFLAVLTHKILTPMNSIIGLTNFLSDTSLTTEQQLFTDRIKSNGMSLVNIYNEILDFAQIDSEEQKTSVLEDFSIEKTMFYAINQFYTHAINNKNVEVIPMIAEDMNVMINADRKRFEQIILLALGEPKHESGHKKITLEVTEYDDFKKLIYFKITHNPSVLSNQQIQYLTDNNKTWLDSVNAGNNIFKFMFAKRLTEMSGGNFIIQKGETITQLHIALPATQQKHSVTATKKFIIPEFSGLSCLIVAGNIAYQQQLKKTFGSWGIKSFIAKSEKDAIVKTIRETNLNFLIISDQLPNASAKGLAKKIKALPGKNNLPILLLKSKQSLLHNHDLFIDEIYSTENTTNIFEKLLKNISKQIIKREPYKLDTKLAEKLPLEILVIEDDKTNLDLLTLLLKKLGYKADTALSGKIGLHKARNKHYDIIFLDIQMPEMDGFKVAKYIRDNILNSENIKTIAISANTLQKTQQKALRAGMVDFVSKPISFKKIEETIIRWGFAENLLQKSE